MEYFFNREHFIQKLEETKQWDIVIIGGGASGLGAALDAALRGYKTLLLEKFDFSSGTSSRSTKLIHGGIRYLAQGNIKLVYEALRERGILLKNAPHLVERKKFIIPFFSFFKGWFYWVGMKLYQILSAHLSLGRSGYLSKKEIIKELPELKPDKLKGGVVYYDAQFDDARLALSLAKGAAEKGAVVLNYFPVTSLIKEGNKLKGLVAKDTETNKEYTIFSKSILNATGVFSDAIYNMDGEGEGSKKEVFLRPSQGSHIVLDKVFFKGDHPMVIPKTSDNRVLFTLPWYDHIIVGTTDKKIDNVSFNPKPLDEEIDFILKNFNQYFKKFPKKEDILSVFSGLRPLVSFNDDKIATKDISRAHKIIKSNSGLISIIGGKWTTYRKMAEEVVNELILRAQLPFKPSITAKTPIYGFDIFSEKQKDHLNIYGSDKKYIKELIDKDPSLGNPILTSWPYLEAEVLWIVRCEMARNVEDVLARRFRILFLDAKAAISMAPKVASIMAKELNKDLNWRENQIEAFRTLALNYHLH